MRIFVTRCRDCPMRVDHVIWNECLVQSRKFNPEASEARHSLPCLDDIDPECPARVGVFILTPDSPSESSIPV